jgi:hypothetical protein
LPRLWSVCHSCTSSSPCSWVCLLVDVFLAHTRSLSLIHSHTHTRSRSFLYSPPPHHTCSHARAYVHTHARTLIRTHTLNICTQETTLDTHTNILYLSLHHATCTRRFVRLCSMSLDTFKHTDLTRLYLVSSSPLPGLAPYCFVTVQAGTLLSQLESTTEIFSVDLLARLSSIALCMLIPIALRRVVGSTPQKIESK